MRPSPEYQSEIARWREGRVRRLRSPGGWLTLVERRVLAEGPTDVPFGTVTVHRGQARLRVRAGAAVSIEGKALDDAGPERILRTDEDAPAETLTFEGRSYEVFRRGDVFAMRVKDPDAPALRTFGGLEYFPLNPDWRIVARFERYDPPRHTAHEYDIGTGSRRQVPGVARFGAAGRALSLEPVLEEESDRLFFMFGDLTNRTESFPGGRFLYAERPAGDEVILDFNTAFNPPCAFTPHATCPVTPTQNRLPVAIPAGELRYEATSS